MLFRIELPVPLYPERRLPESTEQYPSYSYPTFSESILARTNYLYNEPQYSSSQTYGEYSLEVPTPSQPHYKLPSAPTISISSHHSRTHHNTPRHTPLQTPLHTPIHTPRLVTSRLPTPGPSTPPLLVHSIPSMTTATSCTQTTPALPSFHLPSVQSLSPFPSPPESVHSLYEQPTLIPDVAHTYCASSPGSGSISHHDTPANGDGHSSPPFTTSSSSSSSLSSSSSRLEPSVSSASTSRPVTPVISHQPSPPSAPSQPLVSTSPTSIDLLLDELISSEAATPRECSHCKIRNSPLWRRHPETYALLCNACGLYLQANNELRPRRLIEDEEAPPPPTDGKVCSHCNTTATSVWRRGGDGQMLCNACGVYYRLRGRARPLELRADRVKRRVQRSRKEK
jgi:transcription elongation factor Elf1